MLARIFCTVRVSYFYSANFEPYEMDLSLNHVVLVIVNILVGMLFGIELFLSNFKKSGKWKIDYKRLLILGLPLLILSCSYFVFLLFTEVIEPQISGSVLSLYPEGRDIFYRAAFGYILITSFYKNDI